MFRYLALCMMLVVPLQATAQTECDGATARGSIACIAPTKESKQREMKARLKQLKAAMQSEGSFLNSSEYQRELQQSQRSWEEYVASHCTLQGIGTSGPNTWSSYHALNCEIEEIDRRIGELERLETTVLGQ